jgi:hypothetical protein
MSQSCPVRGLGQTRIAGRPWDQWRTAVDAHLRIECPSCGKALTVPSSAIGRHGTCPGCKHRIKIESPARERAATAPKPDEEIIEAELVHEPVLNRQQLMGPIEELIYWHNWLWYRWLGIFLCGMGVLVFLGGFGFILEQPRLRNIPAGVTMIVGSIFVFGGGVWIWRRRIH